MKSAGYNPPQRMISKRSVWPVMVAVMLLLPTAYAANWEQPAGDLAKQIAALAGPGSVKLTIQNDSSVASGEIPAIRKLLERDLRGFGVVAGSSDSATLVRVTLSENLQGGLWVAEVVEGTETRVTMVPVTLGATTVASIRGPSVTLQRTLLMTEPDPVLDAQMFSIGGVQRLVVLEPERIVSYVRNAAVLAPAGAATGNWIEDQHFAIAHTRPFPRDLRGSWWRRRLICSMRICRERCAVEQRRVRRLWLRAGTATIHGLSAGRSGRSTTRCAITSLGCWRRGSVWNCRRFIRRRIFRGQRDRECW